MHLKTNKTTLKNTSSTFSKILKKPADHKVHQGPNLLTSPFQRRASASPVIQTPQHTCQSQALLHDQTPKLPQSNRHYLHQRHLQHLHTSSTKEKHHYYQLHQHQLDTFTTATITNNFAGPSAVSSRNSTLSRPATVMSRPQPRNNYRFHQNSYIPRPHTPEFNTQRPPLLPRPPYQFQNIMTGPYQQHQQTQGHFFTRPYQQQQPHGHFPQPVYNIHISLPYYTHEDRN